MIVPEVKRRAYKIAKLRKRQARHRGLVPSCCCRIAVRVPYACGLTQCYYSVMHASRERTRAWLRTEALSAASFLWALVLQSYCTAPAVRVQATTARAAVVCWPHE